MAGLIKYDLLPKDKDKYITAKRIYEFNRYLKAVCKFTTFDYKLDERALNFLYEIEADSLIETESGDWFLSVKEWDRDVYQPWMDVFRDWINGNKVQIMTDLNTKIFKEDWDKYAKGNLSSWEMEVLCFYYHDHELKNANNAKYGLSNFANIPSEPVIEKVFTSRTGQQINMFKLYKICGTCIAKNKTRGTVTLLTTSGVVDVKFRKEYFSLFDKQISEKGSDGVKHVIQKSWFNRGNMIVVQGYRSGDEFIAKKYQSTGGHQLYKIEKIDIDGSLILSSSRPNGELLDDSN